VNTEKDIKNVTRKIKALLAKTVEAGATEAEAMLAFTKAHELLAEYQLNLSDLDIREEGTEHVQKDINTYVDRLCVRVGKYCECKTWRGDWDKKVGYTKVNFIGIKTDADFAEWLMTALVSYVAGREMAFLWSDECDSGNSAHDFVSGCIDRINERLKEEIDKREFARSWTASTGRDLVPLKNAMIAEKFNQLGIRLVASRKTNYRVMDQNAFNAGQAAGDGVSFNRPIHSDSNTQRLLK